MSKRKHLSPNFNVKNVGVLAAGPGRDWGVAHANFSGVAMVFFKNIGDNTPSGSFKDFFMFTPNLGKMIQVDEHMIQMDWFNHQLE